MNTSYRVYFLAELKEALKCIAGLVLSLAMIVAILLSLRSLVTHTNLMVVAGVLLTAAFLLVIAARANDKYARDRRRREIH